MLTNVPTLSFDKETSSQASFDGLFAGPKPPSMKVTGRLVVGAGAFGLGLKEPVTRLINPGLGCGASSFRKACIGAKYSGAAVVALATCHKEKSEALPGFLKKGEEDFL
jgi:hypothetical protein